MFIVIAFKLSDTCLVETCRLYRTVACRKTSPIRYDHLFKKS